MPAFTVDLLGKGVIVTGAGGSIGSACALALARCGASLTLSVKPWHADCPRRPCCLHVHGRSRIWPPMVSLQRSPPPSCDTCPVPANLARRRAPPSAAIFSTLALTMQLWSLLQSRTVVARTTSVT
jgi:hypothetical protein